MELFSISVGTRTEDEKRRFTVYCQTSRKSYINNASAEIRIQRFG